MLNKLLILLVTALMCLLLAGAASAVTNPTPAYSPATQTDNSAVDGHNVVYEKKFSSTDYDIYITDLTTGTAKSVSSSTNDERNPDISGNIVVWQSQATGGKWQIYWEDTSTSNVGALVHADPSYDQINPAISGNYVVWQQYFGSPDADTGGILQDYDIKGYNLATQTYYPSIASSNQFEGSPDISGNTVVYQKHENLGTASSPNWHNQVYKTTFGTVNKGTKIYPYDANQQSPSISGKKVLWSEFNEDTNSLDIWYENLGTGNGFWVTKTTGSEYSPVISGNIAVWNKDKITEADILMQDISSSSNPKRNVAVGSSDQDRAVVGVDQYGIFVAYTDNKDGYNRVYWRNMDSVAPKATAGSPARDAVNVDRDAQITTTFNEPIKAGNMLIELISSSGTAITINPIINGKMLIIFHTLLAKGTKYTIKLHTGSITDYAGNPLVYYYRSFTTDGTPPKATSGSPARDAVNVDRDAQITTTFNEPIKAGNMLIELISSSGTAITINPIINGKMLIIFHTLLAKGTKYTIKLHTGSITDLAGNPITYYTRSFTTKST